MTKLYKKMMKKAKKQQEKTHHPLDLPSQDAHTHKETTNHPRLQDVGDALCSVQSSAHASHRLPAEGCGRGPDQCVWPVGRLIPGVSIVVRVEINGIPWVA